MPKERVVDIVEQLARPILETSGLELVDIEYKKEGSNWYLRVFIDKPEGIDIDDCSRVSEQLSDRLDEVDPIPTSYFLEVSSPGAERPLKKPSDFERALGEYISVSLYEPVNGKKSFEGILLRYDAGELELEYADKAVKRRLVIAQDKVASARLAIQF